MHRILLPLTLLFTHCFSTPAPKEEFFYLLTGPNVPVEIDDGPRLMVKEFTAAPGYDSTSIAYRSGENELRYWGYRRWVAEPIRLLTEMTARHFRASKKFSSVDIENDGYRPHGTLLGHLVAIEEIDHEDRWEARLAMTFQLWDPTSEQVIWRHAFDKKLPCAERHPRAVAQVISNILAGECKAMAGYIAEALLQLKPQEP